METESQRYFLIVYNVRNESIISLQVFEDADEASSEYSKLESEHRGVANIEVVLIGADSEETIRRTHSRYFEKEKRVSPF
jgi:hypothetical protein